MVAARSRLTVFELPRRRAPAASCSRTHCRVATVKAHASRVLEKLELNNRVQIAFIAHDAGEA